MPRGASKRVYPTSENDRKQFGARIRKAREAKGYSQMYVADSAGISIPYYRRIEYGQAEPNVFLTTSIARVLDTSVDSFVDHIESSRQRAERLWRQYESSTKLPKLSGEYSWIAKRKILQAMKLW